MPSGRYLLEANGPVGAKIKLLQYTRNYQEQETNLVIGANGKLSYEFTHNPTAYVSDVGGLNDIGVGSLIEIGSGIVTARVPEGFYLQTQYDRTPAVYVKWSGPIETSRTIRKFIGEVKEEAGKKYIEATTVELNFETVRAKPIGVVPERASTTFNLYVRTCGQVVNNTLNSCLPIQGIIVSDGWHTVQGVFHNGVLYCDMIE